LAGALRALPRPRSGFVALSPTWVLAARAAWPDLPVIYVFPCLLANCWPFTWTGSPGFSQRIAYLGTRRTEQRAFRQADLVLAPTAAACAEIRAFAPTVGGRLRSCIYGVRHLRAAADARQRLRAQLEISADTLLCAVVGTADRNKNFAAALRALRDTHRSELVVIGEGPELAALRRLAHALDVDGRVAFVGSQSAMGDWYAAIDTVISTSFYDTFPNVVLEALAAGKPVVVPAHDPPRIYSGSAALVAESSAGLLYTGDDTRSLAAALRQLAVNPTLRRRMGVNGAAAITRWCDWTRAAQRIFACCGCAVRTPPDSDVLPFSAEFQPVKS
jgi:glycosyltransferase involved in cell wall biosynthesis